MNKLKLLLTVAVVGVAVALTYFGFEWLVHHGINLVWDTIFKTETYRILVLPVCIVLTLIFFGLQHYLDPKSEEHESHGLGEDRAEASFKKFFTILLIGFFSLVAGASLGPEAVLVPACLVAGLIIGNKLLKDDKQAGAIVSAAAIIALFASFFHSFVVGLLTIFLVKKVAKANITPQLVILAVIASGAATLVLNYIDPTSTYFNFPEFNLETVVVDGLIGLVLIAIGYAATYSLKYLHTGFTKVRQKISTKPWWLHGIVASIVLALLYIVGGPLVMFTGNESIEPLLSQSVSLGILGVLGIIVVKLLAIAWSKSIGYRGGLVFPMIFIASSFATIAHLIYADSNFLVALVATIVGILAAEKKAKILF